MEKKATWKKALKWAGNIFTLAALAYVIYVVVKMDIDWKLIVGDPGNIRTFALLCVLSFVQYFLIATGWYIMIRMTGGKKMPMQPVYSVYSRSNLAKYLPGNVMHLAGRNLLGNRLGISQADIGLATVLDLIMTLVTALIMTVVLSADYLIRTAQMIFDNASYRTVLLILAAVGCAAVVALILIVKKRPKVRAYFSRFKAKTLAKACLLSFVNYAAVFTLLGLINCTIMSSILKVPMTPQETVTFMGLTIISWTAGFIIPGAPGGLGVREAIMVLIMAPVWGEKNVATAAVLLRIINLAGDLLLYLAGVIWTVAAERKSRKQEMEG